MSALDRYLRQDETASDTDNGVYRQGVEAMKVALSHPAAQAGAVRAVEKVYFVATGETHDGQETYTRHDVCPPLCDAETLYTAPLAATQPSAAPGDGQGATDGSTPGPWRVEKRERDGEMVMCWVAAPDCNGFAYAAEILGDDEYRDGEEATAEGMPRRLADCELIVKAVTFYRASLAAPGAAIAARKQGALSLLDSHDLERLARFQETTEDEQTFDIGKEAVKRLSDLGCIQNQGFGRYGITRFGAWALQRCSASPAAAPTSQPDATEFSELMAMPEEQIDAELRTLGIDPDDAARRAGDAIASAVEIAEQMRIAKKGATCPLCGRNFPHEHSPEEITIYRNGMKAARTSQPNAAAQERQAGWISVDEQLPPAFTHVLAYGLPDCTSMDKAKHVYITFVSTHPLEVVGDEEIECWQPLPPAPTGMGSVGLPSGRGEEA
ncbi:hypothetical protein J2W30_003649 [Variovorax boronicumulans]|uniref:DUF551 domain-containing protein n=1 Tax=Variovorax boronicumulans TaxID=436515 RepID=UPI00278B493C|nr:DUF551 domain-containing protein [Variovorax boronicumulans]MDQ0035881.1 hypothetical protein [Variovorax boronicumulans]